MTLPPTSAEPSLTEMVTEGANRIGPRSDSRPATLAFVGVAILATLAFRGRRRPAVVLAALAAVVALAIPGLSFIILQRDDSPARAVNAARSLEGFRQQIEEFSRAHGCARVTESACAACEPIVGFALATSVPCATPGGIVLGADALSAQCVADGVTLTCGGPRR